MSPLKVAFAAALVVLGTTSSSRAVEVTFTTVGTFGSSGGNTFTNADGDVTITFNGIVSQTVDADPTSTASFGEFDTSATTATSPTEISDTFTLDIFQTAPTAGGPLTFVGTLSGTLAINAGVAFVQFDSPFSGTIGDVTYELTEADNDTPGRADLVPPSVNEGISSVEGRITAADTPPNVIPEPSTMLMGALAVPALLLYRLRKKS